MAVEKFQYFELDEDAAKFRAQWHGNDLLVLREGDLELLGQGKALHIVINSEYTATLMMDRPEIWCPDCGHLIANHTHAQQTELLGGPHCDTGKFGCKKDDCYNARTSCWECWSDGKANTSHCSLKNAKEFLKTACQKSIEELTTP